MSPRKATVLGSGKSGLSVAKYLADKGYSVLISDTTDSDILKTRVEDYGIVDRVAIEGNGHSDKVYDTDFIVTSPGIPFDAPVLVDARKRGIEVIGDIELAYRDSNCKVVAVTGSNGKSTTVSLINHILRENGKESALCGNIGIPVIDEMPRLSENGIAVVEISSFQLESINTFTPHIAAIINLSPNHLDRHHSLEEYYNRKMSIVRNMNNGIIILNGNYRELAELAKNNTNNRVVFFGKHIDGFEYLSIENRTITLTNLNGEITTICSLENFTLTGEHNNQNAMVASFIASTLGVRKKGIENSLETFRALEHRMEFVARKSGVSFYNDSKATTPESMAVAISAFEKGKVILIAGGKDKGGNFDAILDTIALCKEVVLIGSSAHYLDNKFSEVVPTTIVTSLDEAIAYSFEHAVDGDSILLSPGCASFDMFKNFEHRGDEFKSIVRELIND